MSTWIDACTTSDIDAEDLIRWDHGGRTYAIYNTENGFFCTDGMCTHEEEHLEMGLVDGDIIECPLHQGRFKISTGEALSAPVCINLTTYPVKVENNRVYVQL